MKVRIILKAKKDFGTTKVGETLTIYNTVFDAMSGIAFYPIDRAQWALIAYDLFTGVKDKNEKEIYVGDILKLHDGRMTSIKFGRHEFGNYIGFHLDDGYSSNMGMAWHWEIIGNIYENAELLAVTPINTKTNDC